MDALIEFDQQLLLKLNGSDSLFWDNFWMCITRMSVWMVLFAALLYVFCKSYRPRRVLFILLAVGIAILFADQIASGICKPLFARPRPTHEPALAGLVKVVGGYRGGAYGFMSSHAANGFALATLLSLVVRYRWVTVCLYAYACLSSFSRMYLGVHYPGDILCGGLTGVLCGFFAYTLYAMAVRRFEPARKFYSDTYTPSGIVKEDAYVIVFAFLLTLVIALMVSSLK